MAKRVGVAALKAQLSKHLRAVQRGETVIVTEHGRPVAELVRVQEGASASQLVIREPTGRLADVAFPSRPLTDVDVVALMREDREDRF